VNNKFLGLLMVAAPIWVGAATYVWDGTTSSNLNTAGNWSPSGPPGTGDDALFDSKIAGIITSPTTLSGVGFSISTIDFPNNASIFSFTINESALTFNGVGIGSALPNTPTNALFTANNLNNATVIADQIYFNGSIATSGSATLVANNTGSSSLSASQINCTNLFFAGESGSLIANNTGTNSSSSSSLSAGYVAGSQMTFGSSFYGLADNITLKAINSGTNSGSGTTNEIGYVNTSQVNLEASFNGGDYFTINVQNTGDESGTGAGTTGSNGIGYVNSSQFNTNYTFSVNDSASITLSNSGSLAGTGHVGDSVGYVNGYQFLVTDNLYSGDSLSFTSTNSGTNEGSGNGNSVGYLADSPIALVSFSGAGFNFYSGNGLNLTSTNSGSENSTGTGGNNVGFCGGSQVSFDSQCSLNDNGVITVSNIGSLLSNVTGTGNYIGYIYGPQFSVGSNETTPGAFLAGDSLNLTVTNSGTNVGAGHTNNAGFVDTNGAQISINSSFTAGNDLYLSATNSGSENGTGTGSNKIGYCGDGQIDVVGEFSAGNNAIIKISNTGSNLSNVTGTANWVGYVAGEQFDQGGVGGYFFAGDSLNFTVTNSGTDEGSGNSNLVGYITSSQIILNQNLSVGIDFNLAISNSGTESSTGTGSNSVGYVSGNQFNITDSVTVGNNAKLIFSNSGSITGAGNASDYVGYIAGSQFYTSDAGNLVSNDSLTMTLTNSGTDTGTGNTNNAGYLTNNQLDLALAFVTGNDLNLTATNSGSENSTGTGHNNIGYCGGSQLSFGELFSANNNANITASNAGSILSDVVGIDNQIGYVVSSQLVFSSGGSSFFVGDSLSIISTNTGTDAGAGNHNTAGYVGASQLSFDASMNAGNDLNVTVLNSGTESSTGSGNNSVGYVSGNQMNAGNVVPAGKNAQITVSNIGSIDGTGNANDSIGYVTGSQFSIYSLYSGDSLSVIATNSGTDVGNGNTNDVGYLSVSQISVDSSFTSGKALNLTATNSGSENSTGTGGNKIGYCGTGEQISIGGQFSITDHAAITVSNTGSILSDVVGTANWIGYVNSPQFYGESGGGVFFAGDFLTMTATNSGTDEGTGNSNYAGYINGEQFAFNNNVNMGNSLNVTISNSGTESSTGTGSNSVGYVNSTQFYVNDTFAVGDSASFMISNLGSIVGTGNSRDSIGYINGSQFSSNNDFSSGDLLTLVATNNGTFQGTEDSNNAGYIFGDQIEVSGNVYTGNDLNITISNSGIDSGSGHSNRTGYVTNAQFFTDSNFSAGANAAITVSNIGTYASSGTGSSSVGYVNGQLFFNGAFSTGANAFIQATNAGYTNGEGTSNQIGYVNGSQIYFNSNALFDNGSVILASNEGIGTITASQIYFSVGFSVTSGRATLLALNSSQGTIGNYGIYVGDATGGGDVNIGLSNSSLYVSSTAPSFIIGGLNGDSLSAATCNVPLIISTDSDVTGVFDGRLTCSSTLTKIGAGRQTLSGSLSITTGPVIVNDGTLIINGTLPVGLQVNSPGIVSGNATISGSLVNSGTVAPGNSIGTLTPTTYTQNAGSYYDVEVNGAGSSDLIAATTSARINGGSVVVSSADGTYKFQSPYRIISAPTVTGTYSSVSAVSPMVVPSLSYSSTDIYLTLTADIAVAATTPNQLAVANQLNSIIGPNTLQNLLLSEIANLSLTEAASALDSVSGSQFTDQGVIAYGLNDQFLTRLYDGIRAYVTMDQKECDSCSGLNQYTVWGEIGGTTSKFYGNNNAHTFILNGWEATLGVQKSFLCDWLAGAAASFEQDQGNYHDRGGVSHHNTILGGVYALYRPSRFYIFADFAYGYSFNQLNRSVHIGGLTFTGKSHPNVSQFTFYGEIGGDFRVKALLIQPFIGVEAGSYWQKTTTENGVGGWALNVDSESAALATTKLGGHFTVGKLAGTLGSLSFDLSWNRQWTSNTYTVDEAFTNFGDTFTITGLSPFQNAFYYAVNWAKCMTHQWKIDLKVEGNVWSHAYQVDALGGLSYTW